MIGGPSMHELRLRRQDFRPLLVYGPFVRPAHILVPALLLFLALVSPLSAQIAVKGRVVYTMAGKPIQNGIVILRGGKIAEVGRERDIAVPDGFKVIEAAVVTPGLVDARATVGLSGIFNMPRADQDQLILLCN